VGASEEEEDKYEVSATEGEEEEGSDVVSEGVV